MKCSEASTLLSAFVDHEAGMLEEQSIRKHLATCRACAVEHERVLALRARIRTHAPRHAAPDALRERVRATVDAVRAAAPAAMPAHRPRARSARWAWASGGALAGCAATVVAWMVGTAVLDWRAAQDLAREAVASHVRATLGQQLVQVASSDRHTVKPWLSSRLDYSPPVRDFAADGFPLVGGRVDYLEGHAVATLVYRYRLHVIDVYVQPQGRDGGAGTPRTLRGFNVARASGAGMDWLAVSDVSLDVLAPFVEKLATESTRP